jgi:hypothetical protein
MSKEGDHKMGSPRKLDFDLKEKLKGLTEFLAERNAKGSNAAVFKLAVRGVEILRGQEG